MIVSLTLFGLLIKCLNLLGNMAESMIRHNGLSHGSLVAKNYEDCTSTLATLQYYLATFLISCP